MVETVVSQVGAGGLLGAIIWFLIRGINKRYDQLFKEHVKMQQTAFNALAEAHSTTLQVISTAIVENMKELIEQQKEVCKSMKAVTDSLSGHDTVLRDLTSHINKKLGNDDAT